MEQPCELFTDGDLRDDAAQRDGCTAPAHRNANCFILGLPDEILISILELVFPLLPETGWNLSFDSYHKPDQRPTITCAQTCKRFHRILVPFFYHTIQLKAAGEHTQEDVEKIHKALQTNPSIGQYCRDLRITLYPNLGDSGYPDFAPLHDLMPRFDNIRRFSLVGKTRMRHREQTQALVRKSLQHITSAQHVRLSWRNIYDIGILPIRELLCSPSLTKLDIGGSLNDDVQSIIPDTEEPENATLSEVSVTDYSDSPQVLSIFLQWPRRLSRFHFSGSRYIAEDLSLPMFRSMLLKHQSTLRHLNIGHISKCSDGIMLDLNDFTALEDLTLSRWNMRTDLQRGTQDANLILAPNLKRFSWDFGIQLGKEAWHHFGMDAELWIRDFVQAVIERESSCRTFRIQFKPGEPRRKSDGYPWDLMKGLRDDFHPKGVEITYTEPYMTRGEWREWAESFEGDWPALIRRPIA